MGVRGACQSPGRPPPPGSQRAGTRHRTYSPVARVAGWLPSLLAAALSTPDVGPGTALEQDACLARRVSAALAKLSVVRFSTHPWPQSLRCPPLRPVTYYSVGWDLPPAPTRCYKLPRDGGACLIPCFTLQGYIPCFCHGGQFPPQTPRFASPFQGLAAPHYNPFCEVSGRRPPSGHGDHLWEHLLGGGLPVWVRRWAGSHYWFD